MGLEDPELPGGGFLIVLNKELKGAHAHMLQKGATKGASTVVCDENVKRLVKILCGARSFSIKENTQRSIPQ